jgi:phosphoribosyl 1,2-cyclic phosphodiesterase
VLPARGDSSGNRAVQRRCRLAVVRERRFLLQRELWEVAIIRICVLASGSSGNATFLAAGRTRILVDAGLSLRELTRRLRAIGEDPAGLDAVLISHEHADHVSGLPVLLRKHSIPVYLTHSTAPLIDWGESRPRVEHYQAGARFTIGDIEVGSFTVPHDAADPVAFAFRAEGVRIGLVTDLGYLPTSVKYQMQGADFLILESNHDLEMLKVGPYPWAVKQRVMGRNGHLSNDAVAEFIREEMDSCTATLVLGHISENNNHPELVRMAASQALAERSLKTRLVIAAPRAATEVFEL